MVYYRRGEEGHNYDIAVAVQNLMGSHEVLFAPDRDTCRNENWVGLGSAGEVECLVARMDAVIVVRLQAHCKSCCKTF